MGKNEIKLRRHMLDPGDIGHYRDYPALVKQHERKQRHRKYMKIFTYSMLVTLIVMLLLVVISYMMIRWEKRRESDRKNQVTTILTTSSHDVIWPLVQNSRSTL